MGRGRAKAKQTKVARQLKYSTQNTDFDSLQRELSGGSGEQSFADTWSDEESRDSEDEWRHA